MTVLLSDGGLVGVGGPNQPFPRSSVAFSSFGAEIGFGSVDLLPDGRTVSYAELYRTQVYVAVMVNKLARQVARLPLKVYRRQRDGDRERVRTGYLPGLLKAPFQAGGPTHLKQAIMMPALINGNAALRKQRPRTGAAPEALVPLKWGLLRAHGQDGGPVELWETSQDGQPRYIDPADVIHFGWRGSDGPIGTSPLRQLGTTIEIEDAAKQYQRALFRYGATPPSVLTTSVDAYNAVPQNQRQDFLNQLRKDVMDIHAKVTQQGKPGILPPGVEWKDIAHTPVEAALIEQRKLSREEVGSCYDVPPPLVGLLERSTFNNIEELHRMLYVTVLGPWLTLIEETFGAQLIANEPAYRGDLWVEFDLAQVLKGDTLQRAQALALQIGYGVLTIDEARGVENRPRFDLPETSRPLYPANNLKPVGMPQQDDGPSDDEVQQAAKAVAKMDQSQVARLLANSGGSVIEAVLDIAKTEDPEPVLV